MSTFANTVFRAARALTTIGLVALVHVAPVQAQNPFAPVVRVNDRVITAYEIEQRSLLLTVLRTPGDVNKIATERLTSERLQMAAAEAAGIFIEEDELLDAMSGFAGRANVTTEEFLVSLQEEGVDEETFREFVLVGLAWRALIRARYNNKAFISESEIDREIQRASQAPAGGASVTLSMSEIFLPTNSPENAAKSEQIAPQISKINNFDDFAAAATKFSVGSSRTRGGRIENPIALGNLPPAIATAFLGMKPGEVTDPITLENALGIFQLRSINEVSVPSPKIASIDYAIYYIAGGHSPVGIAAAQKLKQQVDTCDDLFGVAKGQPAEVLLRETLPVSQIPRDVALELAKLDTDEVSTALTRANGQTLAFVMLCNRLTKESTTETREQVEQRLRNDRLIAYADAYLAELTVDAVITRP